MYFILKNLIDLSVLLEMSQLDNFQLQQHLQKDKLEMHISVRTRSLFHTCFTIKLYLIFLYFSFSWMRH